MSEKFFQDNIYKKLKINKDTAFGLYKESRLNIINYIEMFIKFLMHLYQAFKAIPDK